jgi:hypothetical protein
MRWWLESVWERDEKFWSFRKRLMIDHVLFATIIFYMQMRFDHDSFLLILSRFDSSFLQDVDFESSVSWFWSVEIISFDFTDSRSRREDQDARRWNSWVWIKRHDDDRARERSDWDEIIRKSQFSDWPRWIMIWRLVNDHYEVILLYRETDFSSFLDRQQ